MYRLAILFLFSITSIQGLVRHTVDLSAFYDNDLNPALRPRVEVGVEKTPLWVLDLDNEDLDFLKLRMGSEQEEREFQYAVGSSIREIERRQRFLNKQVKKDDPKITAPNVSENKVEPYKKKNERLKKEIVKIINKFVLSKIDITDPVVEKRPSLSLYFKGPYTSLTIKSGYKQWHYFIAPRSPLPGWFYTDHPTGGDVEIPFSLRNTFYASLLHMLQMFLGFPV